MINQRVENQLKRLGGQTWRVAIIFALAYKTEEKDQNTHQFTPNNLKIRSQANFINVNPTSINNRFETQWTFLATK